MARGADDHVSRISHKLYDIIEYFYDYYNSMIVT